MAEPDGDAGVTCPACGFANAAHSLYCQDCGARLPVAPPSYLAPAAPPPGMPAATTVPTTAAAAPARAKLRPRPARREWPVRAFLGLTLRTVIYAAIAAVFIQFLRAPRDLPPPVAPLDAATIGEVRVLLANTAAAGQPVTAPWPRLNAYLAGALVPAAGSEAGSLRAMVTPRENGFRLLVQKTVGGVPITRTVDYRVLVRSNGLALEPVGASWGRVPLPAWSAPVMNWLNGSLATALAQELEILGDARRVQFTPEAARFEFSPTAP